VEIAHHFRGKQQTVNQNYGEIKAAGCTTPQTQAKQRTRPQSTHLLSKGFDSQLGPPMSITRAFCRLLVAGIFLHAGLSKIASFQSVVSWTHDTMDANGFALDRLGFDDVGLVPMLVGIVTYLEVAGTS
jgi:hypothetical protein